MSDINPYLHGRVLTTPGTGADELVEKSAKASADFAAHRWAGVAWDDLGPAMQEDYRAEAHAVLDAVAADLTRQAVEQALRPIEALAGQVKRAADDRWGTHTEAADAGDLDTANLNGEVAETLDEMHAALRAAIEQARGGATNG